MEHRTLLRHQQVSNIELTHSLRFYLVVVSETKKTKKKTHQMSIFKGLIFFFHLKIK